MSYILSNGQMTLWVVEFYPPYGKRYSPVDVIEGISDRNTTALIYRRLDTISKLRIGDWPYWVKMVSGLYQMTANDYRVYFGLIGKTIVVCHSCRKTTRKAKRSDLDRARASFENYKRNIA
jgi:putative component of toxin-antitoxin plasmid stabilization module